MNDPLYITRKYSPEDIGESRDPELCEYPFNKEDDRQVGDNEIVSQDNARIQVMSHRSSFLGVIIRGKISIS